MTLSIELPKNKKYWKDIITLVIEKLKGGGIAILPTDTLYGFSAIATNQKAVDRVRKLKRIEEKKPFSVMFGSIQQAVNYSELSEEDILLLEKYLPGPYTFLVKSKNEELSKILNSTLIGIRIPDNEFCIELSKEINLPLITTSANIHGFPPPSSYKEIFTSLLENVDISIDAGPTKYRGPSTIVDLTKKTIIRKGVGKFP